jgi:hypothetical protein
VLTAALRVIARAYPGEVLKYAGTIFPGVEAIVASEMARAAAIAGEKHFTKLIGMVGGTPQVSWYKLVSARTGDVPTRRAAAAVVFTEAWEAFLSTQDRPAGQMPCERGPGLTTRKPRTFEEQLEAVRKGAPIIEHVPIRPADPSHTLGGTTGEII